MATPRPFRVSVRGPLLASDVMVQVALAGPATVGVKVTASWTSELASTCVEVDHAVVAAKPSEPVDVALVRCRGSPPLSPTSK